MAGTRQRRKTSNDEQVAPGDERQERLRSTVADLKGRFPGKVLMGSEYTMPWALRRLPFGIPDLDIATNGGAPAGGISMLVGKPGEGKNFLLNRLIYQQQQVYGGDCAIAVIGTELSYDKTQGLAVGVKVALSDDEIERVQHRRSQLRLPLLDKAAATALKEQIGTFVVVPPSTAEDAFEIAVELVKSGDFNIVALDSFGSILPEEDQDKGFEDAAQVGGPAGLNTRLVRKLSSAFAPDKAGRPNLTAFVGINQVRDKLKAQAFEKKTHESGGWSLKHGRFLTVELSRIDYIRDPAKRIVAKTIKWEITKQKAGGHEGHTGQYVYDLESCTIDMGELLLRLGVGYNVIEHVGNTFTYTGLVLGVGSGKAARTINDSPLLLEELRDAVMHAAGVTFVL